MARTRSPNYPAIGLKQAIELTQALWRHEKRTAVPPAVAARAWGYSSLSGPARIRLAALKKYGLLDEDRQGVRISELGMRLALEPPQSEPYRIALREAALKPALFRELYESHRDASDEALRSHLIFDREFSESGAALVIRAFRDTLAFAKLRGSEAVAAARPADVRPEPAPEPPTAGPDGEASRPAAGRPGSRVFSWPLSKGVVAEVRLTGQEITPGHFEELCRYLGLARDILAGRDA